MHPVCSQGECRPEYGPNPNPNTNPNPNPNPNPNWNAGRNAAADAEVDHILEMERGAKLVQAAMRGNTSLMYP